MRGKARKRKLTEAEEEAKVAALLQKHPRYLVEVCPLSGWKPCLPLPGWEQKGRPGLRELLDSCVQRMHAELDEQQLHDNGRRCAGIPGCDQRQDAAGLPRLRHRTNDGWFIAAAAGKRRAADLWREEKRPK